MRKAGTNGRQGGKMSEMRDDEEQEEEEAEEDWWEGERGNSRRIREARRVRERTGPGRRQRDLNTTGPH